MSDQRMITDRYIEFVQILTLFALPLFTDRQVINISMRRITAHQTQMIDIGNRKAFASASQLDGVHEHLCEHVMRQLYATDMSLRS